MNDVDLLYSDVEDALRASTRALLAAECPPSAVIAMYDGDRSLVATLWKRLAVDLGLAGLLIADDHGGAGASAREVAVVLEELGRAVAPVPFLTSSVIAATALGQAVGPGPARDLGAAMAAGERTATLLVPLTTLPGSAAPVGAVDAGGRVSGRATSVAGALEADVLLVPVSSPEGTSLYSIETSAAEVSPVSSLDMTRQLADVVLAGAAGELLLPAGAGDEAVRRGLELGAALLASEQLGIAQWCLSTTVAYLGDRRQFGRVVGSYQALKHRLADLYLEVEAAAAVARFAAAIAENDPDRGVSIALAQAWCGDVAVRAAEEAIQLHAGIGMTWEHPAHLYLKRAKADQLAFGTPGTHRGRLAALVGLPAPAPAGAR
jgi:alkylation response protein AidB-like acyl-CoA dehydrogenase